MGIELAIIGIALVLALAFKGSPKSIIKTKLTYKWTLLLALAGHAFIELEPIDESLYDTVGFGVVMFTYVMLLTFCIANFNIRPMIAAFIGLASNAVVTALNGHMPVTTANGFTPKESIRYSAETAQDILPVLGSSIPIDLINTALSPGDLVFAFGMFMFFYTISRKQSPNQEEHHIDLTNANLVEPADEISDYDEMSDTMTQAALSKNQVVASSILDQDEYVDIRLDEDLEKEMQPSSEHQDEDVPGGTGAIAVLEKESDEAIVEDRELVDANSSNRSLKSSQKPQRLKNKAESEDKLRRRNSRARRKWRQSHGLNALPKPEELGFDEESMTIVDAAQ